MLIPPFLEPRNVFVSTADLLAAVSTACTHAAQDGLVLSWPAAAAPLVCHALPLVLWPPQVTFFLFLCAFTKPDTLFLGVRCCWENAFLFSCSK